jgi:16S rRNA (guanine527-N7)-methyltransferase
MIASRATASIERLFEIAAPLMTAGAPAAFHKGQDFAREIDESSKSWDCDLVEHKSRIGGHGVILEISGLRRKPW